MTGAPDVPPCLCCGRRVAYPYRGRRVRSPGGKRRVRHKCPHGVPCYAGTRLMDGGGFNGHPAGGPYHCPACWAAQNRSGRRPKTNPEEE